MEIQTNLGSSKVHNNILYDPIEAQIFEFLKIHLNEQVYYEVDYKTKTFYCDKYKIEHADGLTRLILIANFKIKKPEHKYISIGGSDSSFNTFSTTLAYNKNIFDKLKRFCDKINNLESFYQRAQDLTNDFFKIDEKEYVNKINAYLNSKIKIDDFECYTYDLGNPFHNEPGFSFFIRPIGKAPADGDLFIVPIDGSPTKLRSTNPKNYVFRQKNYTDDIPGMKQKIKDLEDLENGLSQFKPDECPELMEFLEFSRRGYNMYKEIKKEVNKK